MIVRDGGTASGLPSMTTFRVCTRALLYRGLVIHRVAAAHRALQDIGDLTHFLAAGAAEWLLRRKRWSDRKALQIQCTLDTGRQGVFGERNASFMESMKNLRVLMRRQHAWCWTRCRWRDQVPALEHGS